MLAFLAVPLRRIQNIFVWASFMNDIFTLITTYNVTSFSTNHTSFIPRFFFLQLFVLRLFGLVLLLLFDFSNLEYIFFFVFIAVSAKPLIRNSVYFQTLLMSYFWTIFTNEQFTSVIAYVTVQVMLWWDIRTIFFFCQIAWIFTLTVVLLLTMILLYTLYIWFTWDRTTFAQTVFILFALKVLQIIVTGRSCVWQRYNFFFDFIGFT